MSKIILFVLFVLFSVSHYFHRYQKVLMQAGC